MNNNVSIIVFSKGRPMQLHAYLESLMHYSDAGQDMVTVLYCEMEGIRYGKVMESFPDVKWIKEENFEENLKSVIGQSAEYIMFGCDDVVFTRRFSLQKAVSYLSQNDEVFGFSIRLGENIVPYPPNLSKQEDVLEWKWTGCEQQHFNYPWELDCTVYRKEDVQRITNEAEEKIKNPNYYEAIITPDNREQKITRKHMASNRKSGCSVVITVNRVQETHPNGFDDSMLTDIYSLDRLYNDEDNTLDIEKISAMKNDIIHVGAEYFILRKQVKGYSRARLVKKRVNALARRVTVFPKRVYRYMEKRKYIRGAYSKVLQISDTNQTLSELETDEFSFLRFGDGELAIMNGDGIPFQRADAKLAERLRKLLVTDEEGMRVGIPYYYMNPVSNLNSFVQGFAYALSKQRRYLIKNCSRNMKYIDTALTQVYQTYSEYDFEEYYNRMQKLLSNKDVTIICGEGVFDRLKFKAFDTCKSVEFIYGPSMDAYSEYDTLLKKALATDKSRYILAVLGPTAKVLVYDLHKAGYKAWDMGHYFKDYDAYMNKKPRTNTEIAQFYKPD